MKTFHILLPLVPAALVVRVDLAPAVLNMSVIVNEANEEGLEMYKF